MFKALADPTRRALLDLLRAEEGQTLSALVAEFDLSRQGVMRHLAVLEDAGLVVTRKVGRERHHYLNAVPIQLVYDRWIDAFTRPVARRLTELKRDLEAPMPDAAVTTEPATTENTVPAKVLEIHIATTPERLWAALTDPEQTERYYFGTRFEVGEGALEPGAAYRYAGAGGTPLLDGTIVEAEPYRRLVMTFRPLFNLHEGDDPAALNVSRTTFEITPEGPTCKLVLVHDELAPVDTADGYASGWARIFSGLKTLLETGAPLPSAPPPANGSEDAGD